MKKTLTGIIGYPLHHTLSPLMHNSVFKKYRMNWEYTAFETKPEEVGRFFKKMRADGLRGINVTVPHKHHAMKFLDKIDKAAKTVGAVNTVVNARGKFTGYNTDFIGFAVTLKKNNIRLKNKTVVMFGSGGAAHAVAYEINSQKPREFHIVNIDIPMSERLCEKLRLKNYKIWKLKPNRMLDEIIAKADFIINTTSVGMDKKSTPYKIAKIKKRTPVYDIIYNPAMTPFLKRAKKLGARVINGLDMLIYQGMEAFKLWTGRKSDYGVIKRTLNKYFAR
jgi:shikimate dehydrogenase